MTLPLRLPELRDSSISFRTRMDWSSYDRFQNTADAPGLDGILTIGWSILVFILIFFTHQTHCRQMQ